MIYVILFFAAFLFFVADRKVRLAILPGILTTLMACVALVWGTLVTYHVQTGGRMLPSFMRSSNPANTAAAIVTLAVVTTVIVAPVAVVALLFLGKAIGKVLFNPAKDGDKYKTLSRILYIAGSVLMVLSGLYYIILPLIARSPDIKMNHLYVGITKAVGRIGFKLGESITVGSILIVVGLLCAILICTKIPFFRTLKAEDPKKIERLKKSGKNPFSIIGFVFTGLGILGILIITIICLPQWGRVFFFDGYTHTQIISAFLLLFLIIGVIFLGIGLGRIKYQKKAGTRIAFLITSLVLLVMSMGGLIWLVSNAINAYILTR